MFPPTSHPAIPRRTALFAAVSAATITALLAGCSPDPAPTPTPAFDSENEAFADAEATYRAYNDALNLVDPSDPTTFEATYEFTAGDFEASDRENFTEMHAEGFTIIGDSRVTKFAGTETNRLRTRVNATVCIDVSAVDVLDPTGSSIVNPDRLDLYAIEVEFRAHAGHLLIERADARDGAPCEG